MVTRPMTEDEPADELLNRATASLRNIAVPAGPSSEVHARTLTALTAVHRAASPFRLTSPGLSTLWRVAACLAAMPRQFTWVSLTSTQAPSQNSQRPPSHRAFRSRRPFRRDRICERAPRGSMITGEIRFEGSAPPPHLINFGSNERLRIDSFTANV